MLFNYRTAKNYIAQHAVAMLLRQHRGDRLITFWAINWYVWIEEESINPHGPYSLRKTDITSIDFVRYST